MPTEIFGRHGTGDEWWLKVLDDGTLEYVDSPGNGYSRSTWEKLTLKQAIERWPQYAEKIKAAVAAYTKAKG